MSEVKTNKISPSLGTTLTLGDSGDTVTTVATVSGFGISSASQWRLQADFTGDAQPMGGGAGTIAVVNTDGYGSLGSAMTYASGIFTFPSTGYWLCLGQFSFSVTVNGGAAAYIEYTANNGGAWTTASRSEDASNYGYRSSISICHMMNITDTANQKVRWSVEEDPAGTGGGTVTTTKGDAAITETGFTFIRLA